MLSNRNISAKIQLGFFTPLTNLISFPKASPGYEMKRLKSDETLDRLSELDDSLLFVILSSLPMRDVVRTTLLSKRWKDLWFTLPALNFFEHNKASVNSRNFINRALLVWKGTRIQKLEFSFGIPFDWSLFTDMDLWLHFAKERNVEELYIEIPNENHNLGGSYLEYELPQCIYSCSSIRKLSLATCNLEIRGNVHWHQLKSLNLHCFYLSEDTINQVISSSPQLEILVLRIVRTHADLTFRSSSLKMLSVYNISVYCDPAELTFSTPNLETLVISGATCITCLLSDVSSVTDLTLDFWNDWKLDLERSLMEIVPAFHCVESITLSSCCYKALAAMKGKCLVSPMMDIKLLSLICGPIETHELVGLLEIFPKVERLIIYWKNNGQDITFLDDEMQEQNSEDEMQEQSSEDEMQEQNSGEALEFDGENYSECATGLLKQLKIVELSWYFYEVYIFEFIEFLLKHGTIIEKIVFQKKGKKVIESEDMYVAAQKLVSLQRSFPNVEIVLCKK